jgi:hypothetical protein
MQFKAAFLTCVMLTGCVLTANRSSPSHPPGRSSPVIIGRFTAGFYNPGKPQSGERLSLGRIDRQTDGNWGSECVLTGPVAIADSAGRFTFSSMVIDTATNPSPAFLLALCWRAALVRQSLRWYPIQLISDSALSRRDTLWLDCLVHGAAGSPDCVAVRRGALLRPPVPR